MVTINKMILIHYCYMKPIQISLYLNHAGVSEGAQYITLLFCARVLYKLTVKQKPGQVET